MPKPNKNCVHVRFTYERIEALFLQISNVKKVYYPETDHEKLLLEHMIDMGERLETLLNKNQMTFLVTFTGSEALAFMQIFKTTGLYHDPYSRVIVQETIGAFDQANKSPKRLRYAR